MPDAALPNELSGVPVGIVLGLDGALPDGALVVVSADPTTGQIVDATMIGTRDAPGLTTGSAPRGGLITASSAHEDTIPVTFPPGEQIAGGGQDILAQIDAAVGELCACGCRRPLRPDGPSGYFAGPECQTRWYAAQATDPGDVYDRDDATVYIDDDHVPAPLLGVEYETPDTFTLGLDNEYGTAYRQVCPCCHQTVAYLAYLDDDDDCDHPTDECRVYVPPRSCPRCTNALTGWRYTAAVHDHSPVLLFELFDGTTRTHRRLPARRLQRAPDRQRLIALTWQLMRRDVDRFTGAWLGAPATTGLA